jgi:acetylornithine deacetylase/succinyl-diaminopimelate desuccinylase-like protein
MDPPKSLLKTLKATQPAQLHLLQSFVRAPSPNPPGSTSAAAAVLTAYLSENNIPYEIIAPQPGCPNIVSEFAGGKGPGPRVVLNGHIDAFPVGPNTDGWDRDPYSGDVVDGRVHGRGVVDMKSGTASLVIAYAALYERREELRGSVALCAVSDEETGGRWGTQYLIKRDRARWGGDVMLSSEPSGMTIRFSEKGTLRITGVVRTSGAHGAYLNLRLVYPQEVLSW